MKMKDSFATLFPAYTHGAHSALKGNTVMEHHFYQPYETDLLGNPISHIDRRFVRPYDEIKQYADGM